MENIELQIVLDKPLDPELAEEVIKQSVYVSDKIQDFQVEEDGRRISLRCQASAHDQLKDQVNRFITVMQLGFRRTDIRSYFKNERKDKGPYESGVYRKLVERNWVLDLGPGQVGLSGPVLRLIRHIERTIGDIGIADFKATEREYPTMIPTEVLLKCGYMDSFPQHLSMISHLNENFDGIEAFRKSNTNRNGFHPPKYENLAECKICLCPALCYHSYPTLEGETLEKGGHVETSLGRIARYESTNMKGLERLWEFTQRSIIWLGEDEFCIDYRDRALNVAMELATLWDIDCVIETANDPFFASVATAKNFWQRSQDLKLEMRAGIERGADGSPKTLAIASFNLHGSFFGQAFDIHDCQNEHAASGCASWGLERWALVLFTQHGFDPARWPEVLRRNIF